MDLLDLLFGSTENNKKDRNRQDPEMANMYDYGYDEPEFAKYDNEALREEKFANY